MNKIAAVVFASILIGQYANAADNQGTVIVSGGPVSAADDCTLLSEDVTLNLSNGVFGAYACNTVDNIIAVATCHPTGRKGNVQVSCVVGATDAPEGCVATPSTTDSDTAGTATVQGGLAFTASTRGGTVQGTNAASCTAGGDTTAEAQAASQPPST